MVYVIKEKDRIIIPREVWIQAAFELVVMTVGGLILFFSIRFAWNYFHPVPSQSYIPVNTALYAQDRQTESSNPYGFIETRYLPEWGLTVAVPPAAMVQYDSSQKTYIITAEGPVGPEQATLTVYPSEESDVQSWYLRTFGGENTLFEPFAAGRFQGVIVSPAESNRLSAVMRLNPTSVLVIRSTASQERYFFGYEVDQLKSFISEIRKS